MAQPFPARSPPSLDRVLCVFGRIQTFPLYFVLMTFYNHTMVRRKISSPSHSKGRTFGYCRVSTRQQATEGHSLEDQRSRIAGYCQANGLPAPTQFYVDAAISGTKSLQRREQGQSLLGAIQRGDHIIVTKGDRLFRSAKNALEIAELLQKQGVALHLMDMGGEVLNSSVSRLLFGILMMVANMEAERIGERTASVKEHLRNQGRFVGGLTPVGYEKTKDGRLVKTARWNKSASRIRELSDSGLSVRKISAQMLDEGVSLSFSTVYAVLTNKRKVDHRNEAANR